MKLKISSVEKGLPDIEKTLEGHYEHIEAAESARQALLARRRFSLRFQIYLGFLLVFLFAAGIATLLLVTTYQVEEKLRILEIVNDYVIEIQQARRFEKNYFLYGTNLSDALENIYLAKDIFDRNKEELKKIVSGDRPAVLPPDINVYEGLLKQLVELEQPAMGLQEYLKSKNEIELELRKHGQRMVSFAQDLMAKEKKRCHRPFASPGTCTFTRSFSCSASLW